MAFGDALLEGQFSIGEEKIFYASGVNIVRFPAGGTLHAAPIADKAHVGMLSDIHLLPSDPAPLPCFTLKALQACSPELSRLLAFNSTPQEDF